VQPSTRPPRKRKSDPEFTLSEIAKCPNYAFAELPLSLPEAYPASPDLLLRDEITRISLLVRAFLIRQATVERRGTSWSVVEEPFSWTDATDADIGGHAALTAEAGRLDRHIVQRLRRTPDTVRSKLPAWRLAKRFELVANLATAVPPFDSSPERDDGRPGPERDSLALDLVLLAYLLARFPAYRSALASACPDEVASAAIATETALQILQPYSPETELRWNLFAPTGPLRQLLHVTPGSPGREYFQLDPQTSAALSDRDLPPDPILSDAVRVVHKWRSWDRVRLDPAAVDRLRLLSEWWWRDRGNNPFVALFRGPPGTPFLEALQAMVTWKESVGTTRLAWAILVVDAARLPRETPWSETVRRVYREARLRQCVVLWTRVEAFVANPSDGRLIELVDHAVETRTTTVLASPVGWDPSELFQPPDRFYVQVDMPAPSPPVRRATWKDRLMREGDALAADESAFERATLDLLESFEFTQGEIEDAIAAARGFALLAPQVPDDRRATQSAELLVEACRRQVARRHVSFTQRVLPRPMLHDRDLPPKEVLRSRVVLPMAASQQLAELFDRISHLAHVYHDLGFEERHTLGRGAIALFTGSPGTGKTLAATTLARLLKMDLYKVDASAVASKFAGETERNLGRVFADIQGANAILFFDEADALFGRRGEVVQASDRWANLQISYLLQRIEEYSGAVILATNFKENIDPAFFRRIQVLIEFPRPDAAARLNILAGLFSGTRLAVADAAGRIDDHPDAVRAVLKPIADRFDLSGGNLKNVVLDAAFRAVANQQPVPTVSVRELLLGVARELQKEGKPISVVTFGKDWYSIVEKELHLGRG
jgi:hypothetical protein